MMATRESSRSVLSRLRSVLSAEQSAIIGGVLLGIALCFKPQLAICAVCVFAVRKIWKPVAAALAVFVISLALGILVVSGFGHNWAWWNGEQQNVAISFQPGGQSDPAPSSTVAWQMLNTQALLSYVIRNRHACDAAVWVLAINFDCPILARTQAKYGSVLLARRSIFLQCHPDDYVSPVL